MHTTKSDITAWSLIALAAEPYVVSVLGSYTPILLEQLARENGVLGSDHLTPCISHVIPPIIDPNPSLNITTEDVNVCVLPILNGKFYIDTSSYALYTFSFSVLIQTICVLTISGIADNTPYKKRLIVLFGSLGGLTTMLFFLLGSHNYYAASIFAILANCCFGCVNVLMNSYLTLLVQNYPYENIKNNNNNNENENENDRDVDVDENSSLINSEDINTIENSELGKVSSRISGIGTTTGYIAALLIQITSLLSLKYLKSIHDDMIWCVKTIIGSIGIWWFVWQIPIGLFLRNIYNKKLLNNSRLSITKSIKKGYYDLFHAANKIKDLKDIYLFLLGWFFLSDSITTINSTAILFAKTNLNMTTISLAKIGVLVMISAITGSILIPNIIIGYFKFDLQHALIGLIIWCLCVPMYGIVALSTNIEMYCLAIWYGVGLGGLSTVSKGIFSIIIPKGKESVFFSIFSLTDKTSSIVGPFLIGLIINYFHNLRGAFWVLSFILIISLPILSIKFDLSRARLESQNFV